MQRSHVHLVRPTSAAKVVQFQFSMDVYDSSNLVALNWKHAASIGIIVCGTSGKGGHCSRSV